MNFEGGEIRLQGCCVLSLLQRLYSEAGEGAAVEFEGFDLVGSSQKPLLLRKV